MFAVSPAEGNIDPSSLAWLGSHFVLDTIICTGNAVDRRVAKYDMLGDKMSAPGVLGISGGREHRPLQFGLAWGPLRTE